MTKTLAAQVQSYAAEIRYLKDSEEGLTLSRLAVARAWAGMTYVPLHFGKVEGNTTTIDWPTLRTHANISFREISASVMQLARILQSIGYCVIPNDKDGPNEMVFTDVQMLLGFLRYYIRAVIKNSPELTRIEPIEYDTLQLLANHKLKMTEIHRGQFEIDLVQFTHYTEASGHPEVTATSVDLLVAHGIEILKTATEDGVKLRYHHDEVVNLAKYWQVVLAIQQLNKRDKQQIAA